MNTKVFDTVEELAKRICNLHPACVWGKFSKLQCKICDYIYKNTKVHSFKSNEHIHKKVDGPYFEVSAKNAH